MTRRYPLVLVLLLGVTLTGCGDPEWGGPVSGKVTFRGQPLSSGAVTFIGKEGRAANGEIENGMYTIAKVPFGTCKITVVTVPDPPVEGREPGTVAPVGGERKSVGKYTPLPSRYWDPEKSGLSHTVTRGSQTYDIDLKP